MERRGRSLRADVLIALEPTPLDVTAILTLLLGVATVALVRFRVAMRARNVVAARLPVGTDGIVEGAATIDLRADTRRAVLLLHGFGDTPQSLEYLAAHVHSYGWTVRAPLLPGHGRTLSQFAASRADEWIASARCELNTLLEGHEQVSLIGLSMGGSIATILAAEQRAVRALVLFAPYLTMPAGLRRIAAAHHLVAPVLPYLRARSEHSIRDPDEAARNLGYRFTTPRLISELATVVDRAQTAAPFVVAPTLVIQSRQDNRIPPGSAERAFALFTVEDRQLVWTEQGGHVITVDYGRHAVFTLTTQWLEHHVSRAETPSPRFTPSPQRPRTV